MATFLFTLFCYKYVSVLYLTVTSIVRNGLPAGASPLAGKYLYPVIGTVVLNIAYTNVGQISV